MQAERSAKRDYSAGEYCEIFKDTYFEELLQAAASVFFKINDFKSIEALLPLFHLKLYYW